MWPSGIPLNCWQKPLANENTPLNPSTPNVFPIRCSDQLRELIFCGDFQPGEKIMTERELAKALNVS